MNPDENARLKAEVLRKVGRNIMNFQKIEGMLKLILSQFNFEGPIHEIGSIIDDQARSTEFHTLGKLVKDYLDTIYSDTEKKLNFAGKDPTWVRYTFKITAEDGSLPGVERDLKLLVLERNRLVHQMLIQFNPDSVESCKYLEIELDKQNETIKRHYTNLQNNIRGFKEAIKHFLKTDNFGDQR